jgi:hypothetical protein
VKIFPDTTEIITESGEKYAGDLIVGEDGLWFGVENPYLVKG